jgi:hypothetical protein
MRICFSVFISNLTEWKFSFVIEGCFEKWKSRKRISHRSECNALEARLSWNKRPLGSIWVGFLFQEHPTHLAQPYTCLIWRQQLWKQPFKNSPSYSPWELDQFLKNTPFSKGLWGCWLQFAASNHLNLESFLISDPWGLCTGLRLWSSKRCWAISRSRIFNTCSIHSSHCLFGKCPNT